MTDALRQPLSRPLLGLAEVEAEFDRIRLEFWLGATVGGRRLRWPAVDSFRLRGDKASHRVTVFDPLPVLLAVLRRPSAWCRWWSSGYARPARWGRVPA